MMNSKKQISNILFFFIYSVGSILYCSGTFGRAPAVEPVTGISIDQYREVDPKSDPGFNWKQNASKHIHFNTNTSKRAPASYESTTSKTMTAVFLIAIAAFPIALWFTLMKSFPTTPESTPESVPHEAITIDLAAERSKREDKMIDDDDIDTDNHIHKAS